MASGQPHATQERELQLQTAVDEALQTAVEEVLLYVHMLSLQGNLQMRCLIGVLMDGLR